MYHMQITLGLVLLLFGLLTFTSLSADVVLMAGGLRVGLFGILSAVEAFAGPSD